VSWQCSESISLAMLLMLTDLYAPVADLAIRVGRRFDKERDRPVPPVSDNHAESDRGLPAGITGVSGTPSGTTNHVTRALPPSYCAS
jgi:hypothetical protein